MPALKIKGQRAQSAIEVVNAIMDGTRQLKDSLAARKFSIEQDRAQANDTLNGVLEFAARIRLRINQLQGAKGLLAAYRNEIDDPTFDLVGALTDLDAALTNLIDWFVAEWPKDATTGALFVMRIGANGRLQQAAFNDLNFTTAQRDGLIALIDAVISQITDA